MATDKRYTDCIKKMIKDTVRICRKSNNGIPFAFFGVKDVAQRMEGMENPSVIVVKHWKEKLPSLLTDIIEFPDGPQVHGAPVNKKARGMKAMPETEAEARTYLAIGRGHKVDGLILSSVQDGALIIAYCKHQLVSARGKAEQQVRRIGGVKQLLSKDNLDSAKNLLPEKSA